eukprot:g7883.t1
MKSILSFVVLVTWLVGVAHFAPDEFVSQSGKEVRIIANAPHQKFEGFPKSYQMEYIFSLPYTNTFQASPVKYKIQTWVDAEDVKDVKIRVDSADGLDKTITTKDWQYTVNPRLNEIMCMKSKPPKEEHSIGRYLLHKERGLPHDMQNWTYMGKCVYEGKACDAYQLTETFYERTAFYELYVDMTGAPLYLSSIGQNYFTGAHFDEYIVQFIKYIPGVPDPEVFKPPPECNGKFMADTKGHNMTPLVLQMRALVPRVIRGHSEYDEFAKKYNRIHPSPTEYKKRLDIYLRNKKHVEQHNRRNDIGYTLELNHFADWTDEEFISLKTGVREETPEVKDAIFANTELFVPRTNEETPKAFTWAGTTADGVVKDQAICGSCWAFAAVQALEGQWTVATNQSVSFSEQQIVDCAWDYFNYACEGGFPALAMVYAIRAGGIMSESAYSYKGYDDYCQFDSTSTSAKFSNVGLVREDDIDGAKGALLKYGPLAVSIDAGHLDFRFYKSGVFTQPECKASRTNHAVALIGYGEEDGKQYWHIKNSWSTFWGDKGYIKVDMKYDCGITERPVFGVADEDAVEKVLSEARAKLQRE